MSDSAARALRRAPITLGKVAAVLDASYSMSGSIEKKGSPYKPMEVFKQCELGN